MFYMTFSTLSKKRKLFSQLAKGTLAALTLGCISATPALAQFPAPYCNQTFTSSIEPITLVQFAGINNTSPATLGNGGGLTDFLAISGSVVAGSATNAITVKGNTDGNFQTNIRVYVDWNKNNLFTDAGESYDIGLITNSSGTDAISVTGNISVPSGATIGATRMRVIKRYNAYGTPCQTGAGYGQAEDYTINVLASSGCSGTPAPGNTLASLNPVCPGLSTTLTLQTVTTGSGVTYQWQSSPDNSTWTDVASANSSSYTTTVAGIYYRAKVTCSAGPVTGFSNSLNVTVEADSPFPQEFASFPPCGWSTNELTPTYVVSGAPVTSRSVGTTASAMFNFYNAEPPATLELKSHTFTPVVAGTELKFEHAHTSYTGGEVDTLYILTSTDGGTNWNSLVTYLGGVSGPLTTAPVTSSAFVPTASQWASKSVSLPAGVNKIMFRGGSGFGNLLFVDSIRLFLPPSCAGTPVPGNTISSAASVVCSGNSVNLSLQNTLVGLGLSYQWQSSTDGVNFNNIAGASSTTYTAAVTGTTWYRNAVTCSAGPVTGNSTPVQVTVAGPAPGNTVSSAPAYCSSSTVTMSLQNSFAAGNVNYQWQSSPNGTAWSDIATATSATYAVTSQAAATYYRAQVTCVSGGAAVTSTPFMLGLATYYQCYCNTNLGGGFDPFISRVRIGTLSNYTGTTGVAGTTVYAATDTMTTNLTRGARYPITLDLGSTSACTSSVWIDYNHDGAFSASEHAQISTTESTPLVGFVSVPASAQLGLTGMRIRTRAAGNQNDAGYACGNMGSGESEDYVINIVDATATQSTMTINPAETKATSLVVHNLRGGGAGYKGLLVVASEANDFKSDPVHGLSYTAPNLATSVLFTDPSLSTLPGGGKLVWRNMTISGSNTDKKFTMSGLLMDTKYYLRSFAYDSSAAGTLYQPLPSQYALVTTGVDAPKLAPVLTIDGPSTTANSMKLMWSGTDGSRVLVIAVPVVNAAYTLTDNTVYAANAAYGSGADVSTTPGAGNFVVYKGTGSTVTVTNLLAGTKYNFVAVPLNGGINNAATEKYSTKVGKASAVTSSDFVSLATAGVPAVETFDDSLAILKNPIGWTRAAGTIAQNTGATTASGYYSFGNTADKAYGSIGGAGANKWGVKYKNTSKVNITSLVVKYNAEQWRTSAVVDQISVQYSTDAYTFTGATKYLSATAVTWTNATNLTGNATNVAAAGALDGNVVRNTVQASITGINLAPGDFIWVRFTDVDNTGTDAAVAVDDVEAVPFSDTRTGGGSITLKSLDNVNLVSGTFNLDTNGLSMKNAMNIENGAVLNIAGANKKALTFKAWLYGTGTISTSLVGANASQATITVGGPKVGAGYNQTMYFTAGKNHLNTLTVKGLASATLGSELNITAMPKAGAVKIGSFNKTTLVQQDGILNTGGNLVLKSDTAGTATIAAIYGTVNGAVTQERAMSNRTAIRLLSHPFNSGRPLTQVNDDQVLTFGGTPNVWNFNMSATGNGINDVGTDAFWTPFTATSNSWPQHGVIRLNAAPLVNLDMNGTINQGNVSIPLNGGADSFGIAGNPYPAGLKVGVALVDPAGPIAGGSMSSSAIWTWDPTKGTGGAFVALPGAAAGSNKLDKAALPTNGAFVFRMNNVSTNSSVAVNEGLKTTTGNTKAFFKGEADEDAEEMDVVEPEVETIYPTGLQIVADRNGNYFDGTYVYFSKDAKTSVDAVDAKKFANPNFNFYTLSSDAGKLSVDVRPFETGKTVSMGLVTSELGDYTLRASDFNLPAGTELYLVDKFLGTEELMTATTAYNFNVDANAGSQGTGRFALRMGRSTLSATAMQIELVPNPASEQVTIRVQNPEDGKATVRILSVTGQQMASMEMASSQHGQVTIPLNNLSAGVYMVEVSVNGNKQVKQLVKQ
jgi:hypothetical protein